MSDTNNTNRPVNGFSVRMIRSNMRDIPQIPFPDGFGIRNIKVPEDLPIWADILYDAKITQDIDLDRFSREFGEDMPCVEKRCFLITDPSNAEVATISAWHHEFNREDIGLIHWVANRPRCRGMGLGKAGLSYAMNRLAEWHDKCYLNTSTGRIPAINMYLKFGFQPDMDTDGAAEAWRDVLPHISHPTLLKLGL